MPAKHQKDLRKGRVSSGNQIYHITSTTLSRKPIFNDFVSTRKLINVLRRSDSLNFTNTLAYILMPDHIHWLMQLNEGIALAYVIKGMKAQSAKSIGQPIWQAGYYDHAIRKEEDVVNIARYIIANPIRAGLATKLVIIRIRMPLGYNLNVGMCRRVM